MINLRSLPLIILTVLAIASAQAADKPAKATTAGTGQQIVAHDSKSFCYLADKAYSEGAVVEGRECKRRPGADIVAPDKQPLTWQPPSSVFKQ